MSKSLIALLSALVAGCLLAIRFVLLKDDTKQWRKYVAYMAYAFAAIAVFFASLSLMHHQTNLNMGLELQDPEYTNMSDERLLRNGLVRLPTGDIQRFGALTEAQMAGWKPNTGVTTAA